MRKIKVMITGAGGFLGHAIAKKLANDPSFELHSYSRSAHPKLDTLGVKQHLGDLNNGEDVLVALEGMDAVIHTASKVGIWGHYHDFYQTNVVGTENILAAIEKWQIKKLVYTSTPSVAFGNESLCGVDESTPYPLHYLTHYAQTKALAEKKILEANNKTANALATVALRPHLIFGPGDMNLIPRVLLAQEKGRLKIVGDGENLVDVTYIDNAADAHIMALKCLSLDHPIAGKAYFLGQGPIKLWDFTNQILKKYKRPPVNKKISLKMAYFLGWLIEGAYGLLRIYKREPPMTRFIALQLGKSHYFNHHNLEADLGYRPAVSIEEAIKNL